MSTAMEKQRLLKAGDISMCEWYQHMYRSLCPTIWLSAQDSLQTQGTFPGKMRTGSIHLSSVFHPSPRVVKPPSPGYMVPPTLGS
ncbi:unnamed protein product [Gulo gulo]|uniref:Uncharacterized protein n=1 Tax=Gulo gulo TaxID=48420 RepID=A0A9X9Q3T3_GULGU|nr:unnamed protein product [Gulo gulo]